MILRKINLINFRNYKKINIKFNNKINIFIGDNAQGKTNILESIYILALTKSHRIGIDNNLIKIGNDVAKIKGSIKNENIIKDLEVNITNNSKKVKINGNDIKKISSYISNLNVIIFTPDDLEIIKGSPNIRRNLLNIEISQISSNYLKIYNEYNKLLKTRNEYLKILYLNSLGDKNYLDIITSKLIEKAIKIYQLRKEFIDSINSEIKDIYKNITSINNLHVIYENNCNIDSFTEEEIRNKMLKKFNDNYKRELSQGMTLYGPHRDDFSFFIDDIDLKYFGSQGQQRLSIIAFKLSEIPIFKEKTGTNPILLLDDIFSEIDKKKKNNLLKYINDNIQTIITTTDLKDINKKIIENAKIFSVKNGEIIEKEGNNNDTK